MTTHDQQNASITRQTAANRRADQAEDKRIERRLRQSARERISYERQAAQLRVALSATRHLIDRYGWTEATRVTGLSAAELRALPQL